MMKRIQKMLCLAICLCMLGVSLALPGHAAGGEKILYTLAASGTLLEQGTAFTVTVKMNTQELLEQPGAFRFYLLYDRTRFTWQGDGVTVYHVADGYPGEEERGDVVDKYPAGMDATQRNQYGVVAVQWCALPVGGDITRLATGGSTPVNLVTLGFEVKAAASLAPLGVGDGKIYLSADYAYADTPYFEEIPVDVSAAAVAVQPVPPVPVLSAAGVDVTIAGEYMTGPDNGWWNNLGGNFSITNGGTLQLDNTGKLGGNNGMAGTGSKVWLLYSSGTPCPDPYYIVIKGDVDGNGVVDLDDYTELRAMLRGNRNEKLGTAYEAAGDLNGGGIDDTDLEALYHMAK